MKSPVGDAKEILESLAPLRGTLADGNLAISDLVLNHLEDKLGWKGAKKMAKGMIDARAGDKGWAMDKVIELTEAAAEKQTVAWTGGNARSE